MNDHPYDPDTTPALEILASSPLFKRLNRAMLAEIADDLEVISLAAEQSLFRQGDPGDSMYIVDSGLLEVRLRVEHGATRVLDRLDAGAAVGEMALLTGQPRTAGVVAITDSRLLRVSKVGFDRLTERHPAVASGFANAVMPRIQRLRLADILGRHFPDLDQATLFSVQERMVWRRLADGELLFRRGERGTSMYIVVNGHLRSAEEQPGGAPRFTADFGAGDIVGEYALLTDEPRSRTLIATRDTDVVEITRPLFENLAREHPQAMIELMRLIVARRDRPVRAAAVELSRALTLAILPAGDGPIDLNAFAVTLSDHLAAAGPTALFTSGRFDAEYGKHGAAQTEADDPLSIVLNSWLQEQESRYAHILYVVDPEWNNWTQRCLAQADRLVLVGSAAGDATPGRLESHSKPHAPRTLVLLHADDTPEPSGTLRWLEPRDVVHHLHLRPNDERHWGRLARYLTGRAVGLVLGGGAARGLAHAGIIRALAEAGQPVDAIGGSGMGALIGGCWAMGMTPADFSRLAAWGAESGGVLDSTYPYAAVTASRKLSAAVLELFGERQIEDLWRPFFCVSTNLSTGAAVIHRRGSLNRAVRAGVAQPGLFTPVLSDEKELLVAGGVVDSFPAGTMAAQPGIGLIIGVDAGPRRVTPAAYDFDDSISGWRALWSRVRPFGETPPVPTLAETILRAAEVGGLAHRRDAARFVDILIEPDTGGVGPLDFSAYDQLEAIGYEAGRAALAQWRAEKGR